MLTEEAMVSIQQAPDPVLACILDMGELLLSNGAEVLRVEDTVSRLCTAYGFCRVNVFSITSSIVLTVHTADGRSFTQTRRITARDTNLQKIDLLNTLSRRLCSAPVSAEDFRDKLENIRQLRAFPQWIICLCYAVISAAFAVFFGGTAMDGLASAISGLLVFCFQYLVNKLHMNSILQSVVVSAFTALAVTLMVRAGLGNHPDFIIIGNIMLLIPGIAFTTSLRDIINGDTISGLVGISEAVLKAIAIAIGFAAVLVQIGGAV